MLTSAQAVHRLLEGWSPAGRPKLLQLAVGGRWEEARGVAVPTDAETARALVRGAGAANADVAVEFEWLGHPLAFVGARRASGRADEVAGFERDVVRLVDEEPADPRTALALLADGPPGDLEHVELGAANAWQSVGPLRLWTRGEGFEPGSVARRLAAHPVLARCKAPVALEVAFDRPRSCWLGVEVSTPAGDEHTVTAATVEAVLARLFADV